MVAIVLDNVSVDIPIFDVSRASLKKALLARAVGGRFGETGSHVIVKALRKLSLQACDGDRIALVGDNGSGKSTLLRLIAGVYPPTTGTVTVIGHVSPMFDATLGMSIEATGFENIQIAGTIWGMTQAEIKNSVDDIAEFTELGDYLRLPIRTYSNGMMLRLAFAIATARKPEIMVIDEVIGAGDAGFSEKAFSRLHGVAERSRIIVVAAHNDSILRRLCNKAIWLHQGLLVRYGDLETVLAERATKSG